MNSYSKIATGALLLLSCLASAQKDEIGTEVVNVVKPYTPTISDAFKVKETPVLDEEATTRKENIEYQIFSFPVASTFAPSKGKAAGVDREPQPELYPHYATVAGGNYGTLNAELFLTGRLGESGYIGGMVRHLSSAGGIDEVRLEDGFNNSSVDITYGNKTDALSFTADVGYQNQGYNWYGLPSTILDNLTPADQTEFLARINPSHTFHNAYIGGNLKVNEGFFDEASVRYERFWDSEDVQENRFYAVPKLDFEIAETNIKMRFIVDHVSGNFPSSFNTQRDAYSFTNFGVQPGFTIVRDDWSVAVGAAAFYSLAGEGGDSKFFVYPQINASYNVVGDLMIFYAGAEGTLDQNSYRQFTTENPFLAPRQLVAPTDRQFDVFAGLKGKLAGRVSYNVRGSYISEQNRALIKANDFFPVASEDYEFGNSFGVVYDDMSTLSVFGEIQAEFSKNVSFGINGTFNSYNTDSQREAWNLPEMRVGATLDVTITPKWYAGADAFYVGERKDQQDYLGDTIGSPVVTLDPFVDLNAHIGYKHNERLTGFVRGHNLLGENYQRWLNYPVQGLQIMVGASYKFDF